VEVAVLLDKYCPHCPERKDIKKKKKPVKVKPKRTPVKKKIK